MGLLYQDLIRSGQLTASGQLSPVLPLVLYNGVRRWQAPEEVAELVATVPGGLERFRGVLPHEGDGGFIDIFVNGGRF
jgi:hypothetical protein